MWSQTSSGNSSSLTNPGDPLRVLLGTKGLGVVDQHVDGAESVEGSGDHADHFLPYPDVDGDAKCLAAECLDLGYDAGDGSSGSRHDHDARSFTAVGVGNGPTDTLTGARYDRDPAVESPHGLRLFLLGR